MCNITCVESARRGGEQRKEPLWQEGGRALGCAAQMGPSRQGSANKGGASQPVVMATKRINSECAERGDVRGARALLESLIFGCGLRPTLVTGNVMLKVDHCNGSGTFSACLHTKIMLDSVSMQDSTVMFVRINR